METQVAIVGAGPAGLGLGRLVAPRGGGRGVLGAGSRGLGARPRKYGEQRVRAGVLEQRTVDCLDDAGVSERLHEEGMVHHGIELRFGGVGHRIDFNALTGGKSITVYGQQEVVKDLIAARLESELPLLFEVSDVAVDVSRPSVSFTHEGRSVELSCDVIAGCDGFHGVCRDAIADALTVYERVYPFAWLGILARSKPSSEELIYANHPRGFALHSMRSPSVSRSYLQCSPDEDLDDWPDARIWAELNARFELDGGFALNEGEIFEKGVTPMRSFVVEPMQHEKLFLAGDAAHIVPPTGAKGMNLAIADVEILAAALDSFYRSGDTSGLETYSERCLRRVWRVQHFSYFMTSMLHRPDGQDPFEAKLQHAQLEYVCRSEAAARSLAENYVGLHAV